MKVECAEAIMRVTVMPPSCLTAYTTPWSSSSHRTPSSLTASRIMQSMSPQSLGVICFCIVCLFVIKLLLTITTTTTTTSRVSSSFPSLSRTNASTFISQLPPTLAVLEKAFGQSRTQLFHDLMVLCETANQRKDPCYGHHSPVFGQFLKIQRSIYTSTTSTSNVSIPKADKMFATPDEWDTRCHAQVQLKDGREASVCAAAAYVAIPFPLSANMVQQIDSEQKRIPVHGTPLSTNLTLMVVTVVSNYDATDTVSRSLTFQSACLHGIALHVLGVGAGNHFPPGKKIEQLVTFLEQIPLAEQVSQPIIVWSNPYPHT